MSLCRRNVKYTSLLCKCKFFPNSARSHWLFWGHTFPTKTFLSEKYGNNALKVLKYWPIVEIYYHYFVIYNKSLNERSLGEISYILLPAVPPQDTLGSFSIDDGNGSENVSFKMNSRFFQSLSRLFQFAENGKCRRISLELISWGPHSSLEREKEIRRRLFTSSIKLAIRHFHVVVVQGR